METIYINHNNIQKYYNVYPNQVLALGNFDGLHLGHCEVIKTAKCTAEKLANDLAVMTFHPHPKNVLSKGQYKVPQLMSFCTKQKRLEEMGVDRLFVIEFSNEFAQQSPKEFVQKYLIGLNVIHAVAGYDFKYGAQGKGHMDRLIADSDNQIHVTKVSKVSFNGEKISSTRIRKTLGEGNLDDIPNMLGNSYFTPAFWNGYKMQQYAHCLLPHPGLYETTIHTRGLTKDLDIVIKENGQLSFSTIHLPKTFKGKINIEWRKLKSQVKESVY